MDDEGSSRRGAFFNAKRIMVYFIQFFSFRSAAGQISPVERT